MFKTRYLLFIIGINFYVSSHVLFSQTSKKIFYRNDRFVVEYIKQIQPGDNYVLTGFKLHEFFNNELIHVDSSMVSTVSPVQYKDFNNNLGYYDFGKTTNKKKLFVNLSNIEGEIGDFYEGDLYNEEYSGHLFSVSDILLSSSKRIFIDGNFKKSTGISKKEIFQDLVDFGYDELIEMLKIEEGRIRIKDGSEELTYKSFAIQELNFDAESNSFYYVGTSNKLNENQTFDYDGNVYKTVNINGQVWMAENLKATHFSNGDEIRLAKSSVEWSNLNTPGISAGFTSTPDTTRGYFYNGYTLIEDRNVCPLGFHVPSNRDIARLYNSINVYDDRVKIKANGVAKVKIYPKIFAPIIEPIGAAITTGIYAVAGTIDLVGNAAWAVTDLFILGPAKLWKKKVTVKTDSLSYEIVKRTAFPTYEGFSLFFELDGFHLVLPPSLRLNNEDYDRNYDDEGIRNSFSHLDKLKSSDGQKLTDEYKFNLANDNVILMAQLNSSQEEEMFEIAGNEMDNSEYLSFITLPFTNYERILFWGNKYDHELQQTEYFNNSLFVNRNGAKVRCVKD